MNEHNVSRITTILLLGFQTGKKTSCLIFFLLLLIYCMTLCGNLLIITLVSYSNSLHSPMYFFLSQLSISDILLSTNIVPNMLHAFFVKETQISFSDCISQFYFFAISEVSECLLLTVMSYDRYLAICKPLHYNLAMNFRFCWLMIMTCWISSVVTVLINTLLISQLKFCGFNVIDHFFCDRDPIIQLSCSDTTNVQYVATLLSAIFVVLPFCIVIVSYVYIIITIFKIPSITGRQKVFSTCSSHLTVVCIFYGALVGVYLVPSKGQSWNVTKFLSLMYTVGTPLINPLIYSLRNRDLKKVAGGFVNHYLQLSFCKKKCVGHFK